MCVCVFFVYIFDTLVMDTEIGHKLMGKKDGKRLDCQPMEETKYSFIVESV